MQASIRSLTILTALFNGTTRFDSVGVQGYSAGDISDGACFIARLDVDGIEYVRMIGMDG